MMILLGNRLVQRRMFFTIDLRYTIPLLINLTLLLLQKSQVKPWDQNCASETHLHTTLKMTTLLLAIVILLFLFTSIKLQLDVLVTTRPICLRAGDFSGAVAISLLASFIFPPPHFFVAYFLIICISPRYGLLLNPFKHFFGWLYRAMQAIPTLIIICSTQQPESPEPEPPQLETDVLLEVEGLPMQDESSLEHDFVLVIDGCFSNDVNVMLS